MQLLPPGVADVGTNGSPEAMMEIPEQPVQESPNFEWGRHFFAGETSRYTSGDVRFHQMEEPKTISFVG